MLPSEEKMTSAINLIQKSTSLGTYICWQSKNATESSPKHFLAIEAGKHASKSLVTVKVIDKIFFGSKLFLKINSLISSTTEFSISFVVLPLEVVAPL